VLLLGPHNIKTIFYNSPNTAKQVTGPSYSSPHEDFLLINFIDFCSEFEPELW